MNLKYFPIALTVFFAVGCESASRIREERLARTAVDSFATYYFNWQFDKAARFVTDSSQVWLRYAASQVHEADIAILREKEDATVEIEEIDINDADSSSALVTVWDFLRMDTIGTEGHLVEKASFRLSIEKTSQEDRKWKIRMAGLPQSEKRNRD